MITPDNLSQRIDELLNLKAGSENSDDVVGELYLASVTIATQLYGARSPQVEAIKQLKLDVESLDWKSFTYIQRTTILVKQLQGTLRAILSDIRDGRLGSLRLEYQGQVFAEFVNAAKAALSEGAKDVAAVLACAALEDALKRFAEANGLDVEEEDMSKVVNALKSAGLVPKQQGALLKGMVPLRNKVFHAEWSKVDEAGIRSVIGFVKQFLLTKFV